jgi:hypothetical protein
MGVLLMTSVVVSIMGSMTRPMHHTFAKRSRKVQGLASAAAHEHLSVIVELNAVQLRHVLSLPDLALVDTNMSSNCFRRVTHLR